MFYNFQLMVYVKPETDAALLLTLLSEAVKDLSEHAVMELLPSGKKDKMILEEKDAALLAKNAGEIIFKEKLLAKSLEMKTLQMNLSIITAYKHCNLIRLAPIIPLGNKDMFLKIYERFTEVAKVCIGHFHPILIQLNGFGDENKDSVVSPGVWKANALPPFLTPFNFVDEALLDNKDMEKLKDVAAIEKYKGGWLVEFSKDLSPNKIESRLQQWNKAVGYSSIKP